MPLKCFQIINMRNKIVNVSIVIRRFDKFGNRFSFSIYDSIMVAIEDYHVFTDSEDFNILKRFDKLLRVCDFI